MFQNRNTLRHALLAGLTLTLAACGGGGGGSDTPPGSADCSVAGQKSWLRDHMLDWYYWSGASPNPAPLPADTLARYFDKLLFKGAGAVPADVWSGYESSASYNQFFGAGRTLGYGVSVNGIEQALPLRVRYVEPKSPGATAQVRRGDTIVSINGVAAADLVDANDYTVLSPAAEGDVLTLVLDNGSGPRTVRLVAGTYALTPVPVNTVLDLPNGQRAGYLVLKDFITQAETPIRAAFERFRLAGATELILDLRYNGGGRIATAAQLASLVAGVSNNGKVFTQVRYNAQHTGSNGSYDFSGATHPGYSRVVVLTGPRTCSASELVVNGLKPYVDVVTVGDDTCGKPFGFSPVESCSTTFSVVNFESFNSLGQGRYYGGIAARCGGTDTFTGTLGSATESLTAAALRYLQAGSCPVPLATAERPAAARFRSLAVEPGERRGMVAD